VIFRERENNGKIAFFSTFLKTWLKYHLDPCHDNDRRMSIRAGLSRIMYVNMTEESTASFRYRIKFDEKHFKSWLDS
jgi:hypothetical protein